MVNMKCPHHQIYLRTFNCHKFDYNADGKIDFQELRELNAQFPLLLYPAFKLQIQMRQNSLGGDFWNELLHKNFVKSQNYFAHAALKNSENYNMLEKV